MAHVVAQARREHDEQRRVRVDARVVVGEVRDAVQRDRGLARACGAANHDEAGARAGDQVELRGVDQARDVGQALVRAQRAPARVGAEPPRAALARLHAQRGAFSAREPRQRLRRDAPAALRGVVRHEHALGRLDALQLSGADCYGPARLDPAFLDAPADLLLVLVALLVAVEELRDRRVAPVHDAQAVVEAGGTAETDVAHAPALAQSHVREVGRARIHLRCAARAT
jgi:hypothetical protein